MAGGNNNNKGRGGGAGRGNNNNNTPAGRGGRGNYRFKSSSSKSGLNKELENNIFDLGERSSADLMRTTQIKIAQYVGAHYSGDIMAELQTKTEFVVPPPEYPATAQSRKPAYEAMIRAKQANNLAKAERRKARIEADISALPQPPDPNDLEDLEDKLYDIENDILQIVYEQGMDVTVPLDDAESVEYKRAEKAYGDRLNKHQLNQQKAFALIVGQCTQKLQEKMHNDPQWDTVNTSQKPLELYKMIERLVMKQTDDEYAPSNLVDHYQAVFNLKQPNGLSNSLWREKLDTRVDVAESVGVEFDQFTSLWEYVCKSESLGDYDALTTDQQKEVRLKSKERLLAYLLVKNSSNTSTHDIVRNNLQESFIAKRDEYPMTRSDAIDLLNKYDEKAPPNKLASEGTAFAQKGKKNQNQSTDKKSAGKKEGEDDDTPKKNFWENKECYICGKKGHGVKKCPNKKKNESDDSSMSSKSSKKSIDEFEKKLKNANKQFAQLKAQYEEEEEDESDEEHSHFQFLTITDPDETTTPEDCHNNVVLKQSRGKLEDLNLRSVILLDNQSTMSLFCNRKLVSGIRCADEPLTLQSNGGSMKVNQIADIGKDQPPVWFSNKAITNILSLKEVIKRYRVLYDSADEAFFVYREKFGLPNMIFRMHSSGLHYYDPSREEFSFVVTVEDNMLPYSKRQIEAAEKARGFYASLAFPSMTDYKWILQSNQIEDCPVSAEDAKVAEKVWGPNIAALKGKTTRSKPEPVKTDLVEIPVEIRTVNRIVTVGIDVFFVNKIPFLITLSRNICFTTVTHLSNRKIDTIFNEFKPIYIYYLQRGFQIMTVTADGEFAPLEKMLFDLPGAPRLNLTSANEHEPYIERRIRVVKERVRAVRHSLPFTSIPMQMTAHMVFFVVKLLNHFPAKGGVSSQFSPKTIMSGERIRYKQYCLPFGTYCQVHEEDSPRNSMAARTQGAISMGPSKNKQGGQVFFNLTTGKVVSRRSWHVIPMPSAVIARVNELATDQPQLLTFYDRIGREIGDADAEYSTPSDDTQYETPGVIDKSVEITGVDMDNEQPTTTNHDPDIPPTDNSPKLLEPTESAEAAALDFEPPAPLEPEPVPIRQASPVKNEKPAVAPTTPIATRRSTRTSNKPQSYQPSMTGKSYQYAATQLAQLESEKQEIDPRVIEMVMTQLTLKAAIKMWGNDAKIAAESEMKQLHWRNSFRPVKWSELTEEQKKTILESHIFMKMKKTGEIKGRTVAGGNKQRGYIEKEESSSPMVDAEEEREVAVIDVPNAFIQTVVEDKKKRVIIRIRGMLVDMLVKIAPEVYHEYVTVDKRGNKQILVECLNALYGTMVASLLYYQKFTNSLKENGYEMNPYDPCVWNRIIKGSQCTICFHVDDCKISHKSTKVIDSTIEWLRRDYESIFEDGSGEMKVCRGKVHKYLGMTLDFATKRQVRISMIDYVEDVVRAWDSAKVATDDDGFKRVLPKARKGRSSAAPDDLFKVDEDSEKLQPTMTTAFHNIVAKALYLVKRARPDASVAIAFLTTRVRSPDVDDWRKLEHLVEYLRSTMQMPLILDADGTGVLNWYVDASFAVHANMRGHTGGGLTMGRGFPIVCSTKQKLNTRSSTESELVGVDDMMPSILWTRYFLRAQGYRVSDNIIFQDNKSTMLLERNGKASSSKRTKHINVRYFFITDRISKGEVRVEWCPTAEMVADFMTKPLQGSTFKKFRDLIMGALPRKEVSNVLTRDPVKEADRESLVHK
jgi:hypothetical protein